MVVEAHIHSHMLLRDKELSSKVILCDDLVVEDRQRSNASKNQVFRDFVGQSFHTNQENICSSKPSPYKLFRS